MKISAFKAIRFNQCYWNKSNISQFTNFDTKDKKQKTLNIMNFINNQISNGTAIIDELPSLYVTKLTTPEKSVTSVIGEVNHNDKSIFIPNEDVHQDKLETYRKIFDTFKMQISPVLTFYKGEDSINKIASSVMQTNPIISAKIQDTTYELWKVSEFAKISAIQNHLKKIQKLYIADGHHRFAMFNARTSYFDAKIVVSITDSKSILLKSCHSIILCDIANDWLQRLSKFAEISTSGNSREYIVIKMRNGETFYIKFADNNACLYESIKKYIIENAFEVQNYEQSVFPLPGNLDISNSNNIFNLYQTGRAIIFIPATTTDNFMQIIENGEKLPPTSTWFEPKIIDGFIMRRFC